MSSQDDIRAAWSLDPKFAYLNHGSFGGCPIPVLEEFQAFQRRLETQPVRFMVRELPQLWDRARQAMAEFVGADPDGLVFVPNATTGVNTVLNSFEFEAGDELLITNQEYNACKNAALFVANKRGVRVNEASVPYPVSSAQDVVDTIVGALTARTRLVLIDHVVSQTAVVMPLEKVVDECQRRGIQTLVDGAHAPGMLPLKLKELGATFYTGNCHKWLCGPKNAGFLCVAPEFRERIRPLVIGHGARVEPPRRFHAEFDWMGTRDPSAVLAIPKVIQFMGDLFAGGWADVMEHNNRLVLAGRVLVCEALGANASCPDSMVGSMATIPLPDRAGGPTNEAPYLDPLQERLFEQGIEVPIVSWPAHPKRLIRISAQVYNRIDEYERLSSFLAEEIR